MLINKYSSSQKQSFHLLKNFFKRLMFYEFVLTQKKDVFHVVILLVDYMGANIRHKTLKVKTFFEKSTSK